MIDWLLNAIGIGETFGEAQWIWGRPAMFWGGLVLLVPAAMWIARRHRASLAHLGRVQRGTLTVCRVSILGVLVFVLGNPYLQLERELEQRPIVALLVDDSASMDLPAGTFDAERQRDLARLLGLAEAGDADAALDASVRRELDALTRRELVRRVLAGYEAGLLAELDARFELRPYRFARSVEPATVAQLTAGRSEVSDAADRGATALGAALEAVTAEVAGRELAGVVVVSDGQSNTGPEAVEVFGRSGAAVWTVPAGAAEPIEDVALVEALAEPRAAVGDRVSVTGRVIAHGFAGQRARVTLREGGEVLDEAEVNLRDGTAAPVELNFVAEQAGERLLELVVEPPDGDRVSANDRLPVSVSVDADAWKVLYIDGYPRWDFRFLDHALRRSGTIEATMVLETEFGGQWSALSDGGDDDNAEASPDVPSILPETAEALAAYDVVMLGDVSPRLLDARFLEQLERAVVREGVGLIVHAGPRHMPARFLDTPLGELLPVEAFSGHGDEGSESDADAGAGALEDGPTGITAEAYAPFTMALTAAGSMHPAFELYGRPSRNRQLWDRMPSFYWATDLGEPRAGATVLAERYAANAERPLIVEHFAGAGRVMIVGTDTTYRWRRHVGDQLFHRFWVQALRHVGGPRGEEGDGPWLRVSPAQVEPGEPVTVEGYIGDAVEVPDADAGQSMTVRVVHGDATASATTEPITLDRTASGRYRAHWMPPGEGEYTLRFDDPGGEPVTTRVRVVPDTREMAHVAIDRDRLGQLADVTGGRLLELTELDQLADQLQGEPRHVQTLHQQEVWDNWLVLVILVSLYAVDVFVRRLAGMV